MQRRKCALGRVLECPANIMQVSPDFSSKSGRTDMTKPLIRRAAQTFRFTLTLSRDFTAERVHNKVILTPCLVQNVGQDIRQRGEVNAKDWWSAGDSSQVKSHIKKCSSSGIRKATLTFRDMRRLTSRGLLLQTSTDHSFCHLGWTYNAGTES